MSHAHTQMDAHEEGRSEEKPLCRRVALAVNIDHRTIPQLWDWLQETLKEVL